MEDQEDTQRQPLTEPEAAPGPEADAPAQRTAPVAETPPGWYADPDQRGQLRYWDGQGWTDHRQQQGTSGATLPAAAFSTDPKTVDERKVILAQQIQFLAAQGRRVESQTDFSAILVRGQPVNHTLHAILTIFTCLVWGIVWAVIAGTGGERREMIAVDEYGNVQRQELGKVR